MLTSSHKKIKFSATFKFVTLKKCLVKRMIDDAQNRITEKNYILVFFQQSNYIDKQRILKQHTPFLIISCNQSTVLYAHMRAALLQYQK